MIIALTRRDPLPLVRFAQALHLPQAGPLSTQIATGVLHFAVQLVEDCRRAKVHCGQIELSHSQVTMGCPGPNRTIAHLLIPNSSSGTMYISLLESLLNTRHWITSGSCISAQEHLPPKCKICKQHSLNKTVTPDF